MIVVIAERGGMGGRDLHPSRTAGRQPVRFLGFLESEWKATFVDGNMTSHDSARDDDNAG
jgi:hypothetical protein